MQTIEKSQFLSISPVFYIESQQFLFFFLLQQSDQWHTTIFFFTQNTLVQHIRQKIAYFSSDDSRSTILFG